MKEIWKDIIGYEGLYRISDQGRIFSVKSGKIRETFVSNSGYKMIHLYKNGTDRHFTVHRLVANAFLPNHENKPILNHKDEDKHNNCVNNLEWCTSLYNNTYNNVHLKRKHYVHRYEYELNEIKKLEDKLKNLKASFIKKYPSINIEEIKSNKN